MFLYAFNCCYAHSYVVPRAVGQCSRTHSIFAVLTPMYCRTQTVSDLVVRIVAILIAMSCPTQAVSVLVVRIELLPCSLLCRVVRRM